MVLEKHKTIINQLNFHFMKKIILIFLLSFSSLVGYSQILSEDFESAPDNADASGVWTMTSGNWLVRDNRTNTGQNWKKNTPPAAFPANSGTKAAFVDRENTGAGVYAEEWLITPQRNILANSQLRFFTRQTLDGDTGTKYQIRVSSDPDQSNLGAYTTLIEYTETELSTLTAFQRDYEEKSINLAFTGQRYFAFVKVFTQPSGATDGDRWLVDDVKIVERCIDPVTPLGVSNITATTTRLTWTSTNSDFQVEYGPAGFLLGTGTNSGQFTSTTSPRRYEATGLPNNTCLQFYVRSICPTSVSEWVGPFNWCTLPLGRTCAEPIVVTPIPYSSTSNTSIYGNNILNTSPGGLALCGAGAGFLGGNDVVYAYTVENTGNIVITLNPQGATNTGVFVYSACGNIGTTCIAGVGNATANVRIIPSLAVTAGQTIYIVVSSTTATPTFGYTLTIQAATCPQPINGTATQVEPTSANAIWDNGVGSTATSWEIAVQTAGSNVPSGAGIQTSSNTLNPITSTLAGNPLVAATPYQFWVRADCGGGLFSAWSGPYLFTTPVCATTDQCNYTFTLTDTGVNGWEGGRMQVIQNGLVLATLGATITNGGPTVITVPLCNNVPFQLFWSVGGNAPDEMRVSIKNGFAQTIYALTTNGQTSIGTNLYSGTVDCINAQCLSPANPSVPAATITFNSALVTLVNSVGTPAISWELYVVAQGSPVPDASTIASYTVPFQVPPPVVSFTMTGLSPDTNYTVYVRALCTVNGPSAWSGGTNFKTKEQCPKPTVPAVTGITPFGAILSWTNLTGGTLWDVLVQPAILPPPAANDAGWIIGVTTPYVYAGPPLNPETAYEYYVRTDCGGGIKSTPAGPKAFTTAIACPKPTALTAVPFVPTDPYSYTLGWTNATGTSWQILVQLASEPAPTASSTGWVQTTSNPYTATNLLPETAYEFYVRTDCGITSGVSTWAGPKAFTTIPACYKPTSFISVAAGSTAFSVQLQWNSVATTTAWQVIAQGPGDPVPGPLTTGWLDTDGGGGPGPVYTFNYPGLTPETAYNFYIRGNCGNIIGSPSTPTGPRAVTTPPSCYKPSALTAGSVTPFTASLGWTNNVNSPVTEWQISIQAAGSPAPAVLSTGTVITSNPYSATGLTPNTCYDYYVRSSCGGINGVSTWAGPFNFCTPPTCPQPTGLDAANTPDPTADLSWTEPGNATQWEYIFQAPSGPVPGTASPAGSIITNGPAVLNVVTVNTGTLAPGFYEFYVRSICSDTDKSFWSGPHNFFITVPPAVCASVEIDVATTSPGVIDLCPGLNCVDLAAEFTDSKDTASYTVLPVVFAPPFPFTGGTQLPINTDDVWGAPFTLPFNFCFYGINYPQVTVGSNGVITFDDVAGDGCPWNTDPAVNLPNPAFPVLNAIYGPYQDINPAVETAPILRSINYQVLGVAPCRAFVVNFYNVAQYSCNLTVGLQTSQIVLYETSNVIEVYVQDRTVCTGWNEGSGVIGIQNAAGTIATFPPDRNLGPWEAHNEAWRFTPDGNSNVVFSWLKDGVFLTNDPVINVCVTETTNMTAQAVYTGCGGQITTKTEDVLLRINEVIIPPIPNAVACISYTLPTLTVGNYFSQPGGIGPIDPLIPITDLGIHTIYVYAETTTVPACTYEISFTVEIQDVLAPLVLPPVTSCTNYVLPILTSPFNYYTGLGGTGTMYSGLGGDIINSTQSLYVYGVSGLCIAESTLNITIDPAVVLQVQNSVSDCDNFTLPALLANNTYYTAPGGPTGTGTQLNPGDVISTNQTIYIYAQSGTCIEEDSFTVSIFGIDPPTVNITQPNCVTTTGTIEVTSPLSPGGVLPTDIFISEVTDESISGSSLTYIELFNGTGSAKDLSNYKLKIYNNGNTFTSCDVTLTGILANNSTNVIKISNSPNQGGVVPDQTYTICAGINTNDNIRLTNSTDAEIDLWGSTDGVDFTPNNETGYTYRRISSAPIPSTTWNPADWTALDPQDYANVGLYTPFSSFVYQYNIDGGPWQFTTTFNNVPLGPHVINVQDITTLCTSFLNVTIQPDFVTTPVTTISYTTPVCNNASNLTPDTTAAGFATGGLFTSVPNTLIINATTGEVNVVNSPSGTFVIKYEVLADLPNCIGPGSSTYTITIDPITTPNFATPLSFCSGTVVPDFVLTSQNGIAGTWSPLTINNTVDGTYTFTPDAGQCAIAQTISVVITAPNVNPGFLAIPSFCSGTVAPLLLSPSPIGITGIWSPTTIDNTVDGTYTFTPDAGQCAISQTLSTVITAPNVNPGFLAIPSFCSGTVAPLLLSPSPTGITGIWSPATIDNTVDGTYIFTPDAGQCAISQTLITVITAPNIDPGFTAITPFCSGTTADLLISPSPTGITGIWSPTTIDNTVDGTYTFTPNAGQCAISQSLSVTVLPSSTSDFATSLTICSGSAVPTLDSPSPNGITGTWSPDIIDPTQSGIYRFTPDAGQCATGQNLDVTVNSNPEFVVIPGCINGNYTLTITSDINLQTASFIWKDASGTVIGTNSSSVVVTQVGDYTCEVTYEGCSTTKPIPVTTISCNIQKGISPKGNGFGDGLNDCFDLEGQNVTKLEIFNRYGTKVYSKSNYSKEWCGQSDSGDELPDGTYFYVIERNSEKSKTGWIYINHEL